MNLHLPDDAPARPDDALAARSLEASLTVRDLSTSVSWYRDVVGFAVALRAGGVELLLVRDDGAKGSDRAKGDGFSLQITTAQDIDDLAARIRARGGVLETEPATIAGRRAFRLRDPDGFRLAIAAPREA